MSIYVFIHNMNIILVYTKKIILIWNGLAMIEMTCNDWLCTVEPQCVDLEKVEISDNSN